ncbi:MAG: DUF2927 domain-containing protein [Gemmobacter sp.]|nr:DUF2927 domain-containing protein [Gemmobacter sp.]
MTERGTPVLRILGAVLLAAALTGCAQLAPKAPMARPRPAPEAPPPEPAGPSEASLAVAAHFARVEADLLTRGLLRTDGGGPDTPYGPRELAENFVRIALYDEYLSRGGRLVAQETPSRLRRWKGPVRIGLRFGPSVPEAQRVRDRASVTAYAARLSRLTGLTIRVTDAAPNYWVYLVSEDERPGMGREWSALFPGLDPRELNAATGMGLSTFCMVLAISDGDSPVYSAALAVVRSELPDLLRLSCLHEEIAQGLGLANDYARARPSIFTDDEEFATLTSMDEALLRMLYDPRLTPGMREAEVRAVLGPVVQAVAGGGS